MCRICSDKIRMTNKIIFKKYMKNIKMERITCEFCEKSFAKRYNLNCHYKICKMKMKHDRDELSKAISYIEYVTHEIRTNQLDLLTFEQFRKPSSKTPAEVKEVKQNDTDKNIFPFSFERLSNSTKNLIISKSSVVKMCKKLVQHEGTTIYKVSDASRKMFHFYDENGKLVKDMSCAKLIEYTLPLIRRRFSEIKKEECKKISDYNKEQDELESTLYDYNTDDDYCQVPDRQEEHEKKKKMNKPLFQTEGEYLTKATAEINKIFDFLKSGEFTSKIVQVCI